MSIPWTPEGLAEVANRSVPDTWIEAFKVKKFDPRQPRDPHGRWTDVPGSGVTEIPPIKCGGDLDKAARLISEGKAVELDQPDEVATLLDKIKGMVDEAEKKGEKAPSFNLCLASVKGTNLFCHDSKGIPRIEMPQLKGEPVKGSPADRLERDARGEVDLTSRFIDYLKSRGVKFQDDSVASEQLRATQNELDGRKVANYAKFIRGGGKFDAATFIISDDNYIVDGHHRWATDIAVDLEDNKPGDIKEDVRRANVGIGVLLFEALEFARKWGIPQSGMLQDIMARQREAKKFDPRQPRDEHGRWTDIGAGVVDAAEAMNRWEEGWSAIINPKLRGLKPRAEARNPALRKPEEVDKTIAALDQAISKGPEVRGHLYRGIDAGLAAKDVRDAVDSGSGEFSDAGFASTTGVLGVANNFAQSEVHPIDPVILRISVPPGTHGLSIPGPALEDETLLPRGGHFRVTHKMTSALFPGGPPRVIVDVEWVPGG